MASTLSPLSADWVRRNPHVVQDQRLYSRMLAAHHMAVGAGIPVESDQYFDAVERTVRGGNSGARSGSSGNGGSSRSSGVNPSDPRTHILDGDKSVFLTANERKIATDGTLTWNYGPKKGQPLGLEEFSRRKAAMIKQPGWYDKL